MAYFNRTILTNITIVPKNCRGKKRKQRGSEYID